MGAFKTRWLEYDGKCIWLSDKGTSIWKSFKTAIGIGFQDSEGHNAVLFDHDKLVQLETLHSAI